MEGVLEATMFYVQTRWLENAGTCAEKVGCIYMVN